MAHGIKHWCQTDHIAFITGRLWKTPIQNLPAHGEPATYQSLKPAIVSPRAHLIGRMTRIVGRPRYWQSHSKLLSASAARLFEVYVCWLLIPAAFWRQ